MTSVTHDAVLEAASRQEPTTAASCTADLLFAASGIIGAVLGSVISMPYIGGEYAAPVGAVGAMLGSGLFASLTCLPHRNGV
jgi:hypothetical protein